MIIKLYIISIFLTITDEMWNINNPRPNPIKTYNALQWEKDDFYTQKINNEWVLRKYRKTDDETKRYVRTKYWKKRLKFKK
tara:strand:- start:254 stop:496 length:243 start_codon:yes stop_codon:yes gene_type:complete